MTAAVHPVNSIQNHGHFVEMPSSDKSAKKAQNLALEVLVAGLASERALGGQIQGRAQEIETLQKSLDQLSSFRLERETNLSDAQMETLQRHGLQAPQKNLTREQADELSFQIRAKQDSHRTRIDTLVRKIQPLPGQIEAILNCVRKIVEQQNRFVENVQRRTSGV